MAFVVEDGTGLSNSNAYISVEELVSYAGDRGIDVSCYDTQDMQGAIVLSSLDWIDPFYTFKGEPLNSDQAMQLPTHQVGMEPKIKQAVCMATILQLQGNLELSVSSQNGAIKKEFSKVDVIEEEIEYQEGTQLSYKQNTPAIDRLLQPYLTVSGTGGLIRGF